MRIAPEPPGWARAYIGLPFKEKGRDRDGVDCWGGVRLVLLEQAGIETPAYLAGYEGTGRADAEDIARLIAGGLPDYLEIPRDAGAERPLDVVLMRRRGLPLHVGIVAAPGWMLHAERGADMAAARYHGFDIWQSIIGFYRHLALVNRTAA